MTTPDKLLDALEHLRKEHQAWNFYGNWGNARLHVQRLRRAILRLEQRQERR